MRLRRPVVVVGALVVALGGSTPAVSKPSLSTASTVVSLDTPLPPDTTLANPTDLGTRLTNLMVSGDLALYQSTAGWTLRRISSGAILGTWAAPDRPYLSDGVVSLRTLAADGSWLVTRILPDGSHGPSSTVPAGGGILYTGRDFLLYASGSVPRVIVLDRVGQAPVTLMTTATDASLAFDEATREAFIRIGDAVVAADVQTALVRQVGSGAPTGCQLAVGLTTVHCLAASTAYDLAGVSFDRAGSAPNPESVSSVHAGTWGVIGDALAVVPTFSWPLELHLVSDPAAGTVGPAVATLLRQDLVARAGPGRVATYRADPPQGRIVVSDASGDHELLGLPTEAAFPLQVALTPSGAVVDFKGATAPGGAGTLFVPDGASGPWSPTLDGLGPLWIGGPIDAEGDVVLHNEALVAAALDWPGGHRSVPGRVDLGAGGQVVRVQEWGKASAVYQDTHTGTVLADAAPLQGPNLTPWPAEAVEGTTVWRGPDATGLLSASDLVSGAVVRTVQVGVVGPDCAVSQVRGRWALLRSSTDAWVVDLLNVLAPVHLTGTVTTVFHLGSHTLVAVSPYTGLTVYDLGTERRTATVPASWAAVRGDRLAWIGVSDKLVHRVDLSPWVSDEPTSAADTVGPSGSATTAAYTRGPVTTRWTMTDVSALPSLVPSGVASVDLRYAVGSAAPVVVPGVSGSTFTLPQTPPSGTKVCFAVRGTDQAGNTGPWSAGACSTVDLVPPTTPTLSFAPTIFVTRTVDQTLTARWLGRDALSGVGSYSFSVAYAGQGVNPYDPALHFSPFDPTTAGSFSTWARPGEQFCVRVRAVDRVGNAGPLTGACSAILYDDRDMWADSRTTRPLTASYASNGTLTQLRTTGATMRMGLTAGRKVVVAVVRGPGQGAFDVYVGLRKVGRVSLASTTWKRATVTLSTSTFLGASVRLVSVSSRPSLVDGIVTLR